MQEGQYVYIDTYGDVYSLGNLTNRKYIESKLYTKTLTEIENINK